MRIHAKLLICGDEIVYRIPPDYALEVFHWLRSLSCVTQVWMED